MSTFTTSDLHLFHKFVARLRWEKMYPHQSPDAMDVLLDWHNTLLAGMWDKTVGKKDRVFILGDLAVTSTKGGLAKVFEWIDARPGEKILVYGNHDPVHPMFPNSHTYQKLYLEVFTAVEPFKTRKLRLPDGEQHKVMMSHFPYMGDSGDTEREVQYRLRNEGITLLHGHTHSNKVVSYAVLPRAIPFSQVTQIHVGVDAWDYTPVSDGELIKVITS